METSKHASRDVLNAVRIIQDAGGEIKGRTKLQKIAFLLEATGLGVGFEFEYHRFGPYSDQLTNALSLASVLGMITESEYPTNWGGFYSVFKTPGLPLRNRKPLRIELIRQAVASDPIELELAATAAFLAKEGEESPWLETERRKPTKAKSHLTAAKDLYLTLQALPTPQRLPDTGLNSRLASATGDPEEAEYHSAGKSNSTV